MAACTLQGTGTSVDENAGEQRHDDDDDDDDEPDTAEPEDEFDEADDVGSKPGKPRDAGLDASRADAAPPDARAPASEDDARAQPPDAAEPGPDEQDAGGGPPDAAVDPDVVRDAGPLPNGECSFEGALAAEVNFAVDWRGTNLAGIVPLLAAGSGHIRVVVRLEMRGNSNRKRSVVTACEASMPDFAAGNALVGTEQFGGYIPNESWDEPAMPRWDLGWDFTCMRAGCTLGSETIVATLGARASGQDVWPGRTGPISQIVPIDHDQDGLTAMTFLSRTEREIAANGEPYAEIPVSWTLTARASKVLIALQLAGQFEGEIVDCNSLVGRVTAGRVEARALSCLARDSFGQDSEYVCSPEQTRFIDENLPNWTVTGGNFRARPIAADADCAAVRAIWY